MIAELRAAIAGPNNDTRSWVSYGVVDRTPNPVTFDPDLGPLVNVTLQPAATPVTCRVASFISGSLEGSWYPFGPGDEVIVVIPQGDEKSGPVIVGRLNQKLDKFPTQVAGMDPTENKLGFMRMRAPFVFETASGFLIRSVVTNAQFGIDDTGRFLVNDGSGSRFMLSSDVVGLETADAACVLQLKTDAKEAVLRGGEARMTLGDSSNITVPGTLNIGTSGSAGLGHAVTIEQVIVLIEQVLNAIFLPNSSSPNNPVKYKDLAITNSVLTIPVGIAAAAAFPINPLYTAALGLGLLIPPDPLGLKPGVGRGGLLL